MFFSAQLITFNPWGTVEYFFSFVWPFKYLKLLRIVRVNNLPISFTCEVVPLLETLKTQDLEDNPIWLFSSFYPLSQSFVVVSGSVANSVVIREDP